MREIKFRLRDRHNKIVGYEKWYVGEWHKDEGGNFHPDSGYFVAPPCWLYSLNNKRWTPTYISHRFKDQYTGLLDKNGVEIYKGGNLSGDRWFPNFDIPAHREKRHLEGYVCWDKEAFGWSIQTKDTQYCLFDILEPEVTGEIWENKELLDGNAG